MPPITPLDDCKRAEITRSVESAIDSLDRHMKMPESLTKQLLLKAETLSLVADIRRLQGKDYF